MIHHQPLISPMRLELTAAEELILMENLAVFEKNGFRIRIDENATAGDRVLLLSVPFSKSAQFGVEDVRELASILEKNFSSDATSSRISKDYLTLKNDNLHGSDALAVSSNVNYIPKLTTLFASRACRQAVMIGTSLNQGQMFSIIKKLEGLHQPWNCPHGRPTVRHLCELTFSKK